LKTATVITALVLLGTVHGQTPGDVVFALRATRSPAVYQIGERIELELSFSTAASGKYGIVSTSEPRDASLLNETYSISPATGAVDPRENERAMPWGVGGSFMSSERALSDVPVIRHADLNEWLRVTQPGHYLLHAVSPRVFSVGEVPQLPDSTSGNHPVASNEIELTIVGADAAELANQLRGITAILDSDENQDRKLQAARSLAYLDTPEAAAEMARRIGLSAPDSQVDWVWFKGLSQSSHGDAAIPIFKARLGDAQETKAESIIPLLARLVLEQEYRGKPLPPYKEGDPKNLKIFQEAISERQKRYNDLTAEYFAELLASLPRRSGPGRVTALFTLWSNQESRLEDDAPASTEIIRLRAEIIAAFDELAPAQQRSILDFYWKRLGNKLLPMVRRMATEATGDKEPNLRDISLQRWCDFDPEDCEGAVIAEIKNRNSRMQVSTLLALPAGERPVLDSILAARLAESRTDAQEAQRIAAFIERYASKALMEPVQNYMTGPRQGPIEICEVSAHLLAYLLRVNEESALPLVASALGRRGPQNGCARSLLTTLAELHYAAPLSDMAEAVVRGDPDPEVAGNAALMLSAHGPASAKSSIWERFAAWSKKWTGREEELRYRPLGVDSFQGERTLEDNFAFALGNAKAWKISPGDYNLLSRLCVTQNCRNNAKNWSEQR
jgi:hypothetical protein